MYELEIKTKSFVRKIRNPRMAKDNKCLLGSVVQVVDWDGKRYSIGRCMNPTHAILAAEDINKAIRKKEPLVRLKYYLS